MKKLVAVWVCTIMLISAIPILSAENTIEKKDFNPQNNISMPVNQNITEKGTQNNFPTDNLWGETNLSINHVPEIMTSVNYNIPINAIIESDFGISVASLYYKNVGQSTYNNVSLMKTGPNTYYNQIPAQLSTGELQYYLTVTDLLGNNISSPPILPDVNPHIVAVHSFGHPIISHEPMVSYGNSNLEISAIISDDVGIASVILYYKTELESVYTAHIMNNIGGHLYSATINSTLARPNNLTYYINATDGTYTVSHPNNINDPHRIQYLPQEGNLRVAIQGDICGLNPILNNDSRSMMILNRIYDESLTTNPDTEEIIPYIAVGSANYSSKSSGWTWDDCTVGIFGFNPRSTWTGAPMIGEAVIFYDFENVTWHDGTQMNIRDVMFSMHMAAQIPEWSAQIDPLKDLGGQTGSNYSSTHWLHIYKIWESPDHLQAALKFELQILDADIFRETLCTVLYPYHIWGSTISGQNINTTQIWCDTGYNPVASESWNLSQASSYENNPPIGSGLFKFEYWIQGNSSKVSTFREHFFNPNYKYTDYVKDPYGESLARQPYIDSITFKAYNTTESAILALKASDLDYIAWDITPQFVQELQEDKGISIYQYPETGFTYLAYNMRKTSFGYKNGDPAEGDLGKPFRKAVAHCIDKHSIVRTLLFNMVISADGPIPSGSEWYNHTIPHYSFDPSEAKHILANAGYGVKINGTGEPIYGVAAEDAAGPGNWWVNPNGSNIGSSPDGKIEILTPDASYDPIKAQVGIIIANQCREVGIYTESIPLNSSTIMGRLDARDFDICISNWTIDNEPYDFLWELFHSSNAMVGLNYPGYQNASFDAQIELAKNANGYYEQKEYIYCAQAIIAYDLPYDVMYFRTNIEAFRSDRLIGWSVGYGGGSLFNDLSLHNLVVINQSHPSLDEKHSGGTLRVAIKSEPDLINPLVSSDESSQTIIDLVFDSLARIDPDSLEIIPWIAGNWTVYPDRVFVTLRGGVYWHDSQLLDANDVKYTFDTYALPYITSVNVIDTHTLEFILTYNTSKFFTEAILMKIIPDGFSSMSEGNGCGPFKLVYSNSTKTVLEVFNNYFNEPPNIDGVEFTYYPYLEQDFSANYPYWGVYMLNADPRWDGFYRAAYDIIENKIDFIGWDLNISNITFLIEVNYSNAFLFMNPNSTTLRINALRQMNLGFNCNNSSVLNDVNLRKAVAYVMDKEELSRYYLLNDTKSAKTLTSPENIPYYNSSIPNYTKNIDMANTILDAAGYLDRNSDGWRDLPTSPYDSFQLRLLGPNLQTSMRDFNALYTMSTNIVIWLQQIGLNVSLISENYTTRWQLIENDDFDIYLDFLETDRDPDFLNYLAGSGSPSNFANYANATMDYLLDRMNNEMDSDLRAEYAKDCFGWLGQEIPYLPLLDIPQYNAYNNNGFSGWKTMLGGIDNFWSYLSVYPVFDTTPIDQPQALHAFWPDSDNVQLTWTPNDEEDITGYAIYRSDVAGGPYTEIASVGKVTTYLDYTIIPETNYYYVITGLSPESEYSYEVSTNTIWAIASGPISNNTNNSTPQIEYQFGNAPTSVEIYYSNNAGMSWVLWGTDLTVDGVWTPGSNLPTSGTYWWNARAMGVINETIPSGAGSRESGTYYVLDILQPYVLSSNPANGATSVLLDKKIAITFNEAINSSSYTYTIEPNLGGLSTTWNGDNTVVTIAHNNFAISTEYWVNITFAMDSAGNALLPTPYTFSFTSGTMVSATAMATGPVGSSNVASIYLIYTWEGEPSSINLYYTTNSGITWTFIGNDATVDGSYAWTVPASGTYGWIAQAVGAGSEEPSPPADSTAPEAQSFLLDMDKPTSACNAIGAYWCKTSPISITSIASDGAGSGVAFVELWYRFSANNVTWGAWTKFDNDTSSPWSWNFNFPGDQGHYQFYSRAGDNVGNYENAPVTRDTLSAYDSVAPTSSVDSLGYETATDVLIINYGKSDSLSGVKNVTLWYSHSLTGTAYGTWLRFDTESVTPEFAAFNFNFSKGDGYYQFYSRATDMAGNWENAPLNNDTWVLRRTIISPNILSVTHNVATTLTVDDIVIVNLIGDPGCISSFSIGTMAIGVQMYDDGQHNDSAANDGIYSGSYTIQAGDDGNWTVTGYLDNGVGPASEMDAADTILVDTIPAVIVSVTHDATRTLTTGDVITVTLTGEKNCTAWFELGTVVYNVTMYDDGLHGDGAANDGVYVGTYTVQFGNDGTWTITGWLDDGVNPPSNKTGTSQGNINTTPPPITGGTVSPGTGYWPGGGYTWGSTIIVTLIGESGCFGWFYIGPCGPFNMTEDGTGNYAGSWTIGNCIGDGGYQIIGWLDDGVTDPSQYVFPNTITIDTTPTFVHLTDSHIAEWLTIGLEPVFMPSLRWVDMVENISELPEKPFFIMISGDLVDISTTENWQLFHALMNWTEAQLSIPVLTIPGNHDYRDMYLISTEDGADYYYNNILPGYYTKYGIVYDIQNKSFSFDIGIYHFIFMDVNPELIKIGGDNFPPTSSGPTQTQLTWLEHELQQHISSINFIIMHNPAVNTLENPDDGIISNSEAFIDICENPAYNVRMILTGHTHANAILDRYGNNYIGIGPQYVQTASCTINAQYRVITMTYDQADSKIKDYNYQDVIIFTAHSPVNLHVYDSLGRHVGVNATTGEIDYQIPGCFYNGPGSVPEVISVYAGEQYRFVIEGTSNGTMNCTVEIIKGGVSTISEYINVPIKEDTYIETEIQTDGTYDDAIFDTDEDDVDNPEEPLENTSIGDYWWLILIIVIVAIIALLFMVKMRPGFPEHEYTEAEEQAEDGIPPEPIEDISPPPAEFEQSPPKPQTKPPLSNVDKIANLKKAYANGKISQEMYDANMKKFTEGK